MEGMEGRKGKEGKAYSMCYRGGEGQSEEEGHGKRRSAPQCPQRCESGRE
jgi:hypothetical protein